MNFQLNGWGVFKIKGDGMECCSKELQFKEVGGIEHTICVAHCDTCQAEYHKKKSSDIIYKFSSDCFVCNTCGSDIVTASVAHTVRDGLFPLSGSGRVENERVPYCPKCEEEPSFHGKPIGPE